MLDVRVLAFDVFGTAVDWRDGVTVEVEAVARERKLTVDAPALADAWRRRAQQLWASVAKGDSPYVVMDELHGQALDELAGRFRLQTLNEKERWRLINAWHRLPAWPDAAEGLSRLRHIYVVTTLSNGGMAQLVDLAKFNGLPFDCILSTELVRTYKPDPRVYQLVPTLLRVASEQAMMVACHANDLAAARAQGFKTAFVRRPQEWGTGKVDEPGFPVDIMADDFNHLASKLGV